MKAKVWGPIKVLKTTLNKESIITLFPAINKSLNQWWNSLWFVNSTYESQIKKRENSFYASQLFTSRSVLLSGYLETRIDQFVQLVLFVNFKVYKTFCWWGRREWVKCYCNRMVWALLYVGRNLQEHTTRKRHNVVGRDRHYSRNIALTFSCVEREVWREHDTFHDIYHFE